LRGLVVGGLGMLGHRFWIESAQQHDTWVTVHGRSADVPQLPGIDRARIIDSIDVLENGRLEEALRRARPDVVVNCVGLVKQHESARHAQLAIALNALLPHRLVHLCESAGARLVHVSTDCVFSGDIGGYTEESRTDPVDLYGRSKLLGEVAAPHVITVRTSMVGREMRTQHGLVEWFLAQRGTVRGYTRAIFSGLTTGALSQAILDHVVRRPDLNGLYHLSAAAISKYDVLVLLNEAYHHGVVIEPYAEVALDRSLDSTRFRRATGYTPPSWTSMIETMAHDDLPYERWRAAA